MNISEKILLITLPIEIYDLEIQFKNHTFFCEFCKLNLLLKEKYKILMKLHSKLLKEHEKLNRINNNYYGYTD